MICNNIVPLGVAGGMIAIMGPDRCIFCNVVLDASQKNLPSSRTEEHVFARWFRGAVVNDKMKMFTGTVRQGAVLHRHPPLERLVNKTVCRKCNNGWMATLEESVAPLFQRLIAGETADKFSNAEVEFLARWTGKTAAVLSYATPQRARVPRYASRTLRPGSTSPPKMAFFYSHIAADVTLEGGYLQLIYGTEIGLVGTDEVPGTRFTICVYNHCLTVDFPPIVEGATYDLRESCSAMLWPRREPAGAKMQADSPMTISDVLFAICNGVKTGLKMQLP